MSTASNSYENILNKYKTKKDIMERVRKIRVLNELFIDQVKRDRCVAW